MNEKIEALRQELDQLDRELLEKVAERMRIVGRIGAEKARSGRFESWKFESFKLQTVKLSNFKLSNPRTFKLSFFEVFKGQRLKFSIFQTFNL